MVKELPDEECLTVVLKHIDELRCESARLASSTSFPWRRKRMKRKATIDRQIGEWERVKNLILCDLAKTP